MQKRRTGGSGKRSTKKRGKKSISGRARGHEKLLRVTWSGFRPMYDFWGQEIKRFYKLETLARATEWMLQTHRDRFLLQGVQEALGDAPVISLAFELFQEGKFQLIFRVRAANAKRKMRQFAFVVAKGDDDMSAVAEMEHKNLKLLHGRAPNRVVKPFRGGWIYMPDRYRREEKGRQVYAYLTQWLSGYHELGVGQNLQFIINLERRHTFTVAQTEGLKGRMIEVIARTYSPAKRDCMGMPQVASGDFVVTRAGREIPKIKLIACRSLQRKVTPARLIDHVAAASWDWGDREFALMPADPAMLLEGLAAAVGMEEARGWLRQYVKSVSAGRLPERDTLPLDEATALAE